MVMSVAKAEYKSQEQPLAKDHSMIGNDGKPVSRDMIRAAVATYNTESRGSKEFAAIPRALITILDNLAVGKTGYVKAADGQLQVSRRKDKSVSVT